MNVGSLFSGAGLMDWGLTLAGFEHSWFCEREPYCRRVLELRWPGVPVYEDVRDVGGDVAPVDLLAGGFPCQPFSSAGRRRGKEDERWLWPEFARIIGELRPRYVFVENVPGLLARHGGMGNVLGDLASLGYDAEWDSLRAADFGAPHRRERVWIVAYAQGSERRGAQQQDVGAPAGSAAEPRKRSGAVSRTRDMADTDPPPGNGSRPAGQAIFGPSALRRSGRCGGLRGDVQDAYGGTVESRRGRLRAPEASELGHADLAFQDTLTASGGSRRAACESGWWATEPAVGRVAHGVPDRLDRLAAIGNGVVPQIAQWIGERILERERAR